jgi:hypothetical protein
MILKKMGNSAHFNVLCIAQVQLTFIVRCTINRRPTFDAARFV